MNDAGSCSQMTPSCKLPIGYVWYGQVGKGFKKLAPHLHPSPIRPPPPPPHSTVAGI